MTPVQLPDCLIQYSVAYLMVLIIIVSRRTNTHVDTAQYCNILAKQFKLSGGV